jgi:MinD superfamily P-loop ATPase
VKSIVFASGKGGTGKTTLTALAAVMLAENHRLVLADCDVEASNLPIALSVTTTASESFSGGAEAFIDPIACRGCGVCLRACRFDALVRPKRDEESPAYRVDPWLCEGCGACVPSCGYHAISMQKKSAGEVFAGTSAVGPVSFGQLGPGEDLSGKLVTEVRSRAKTMAEESDAELLLIDGPPGVGCPVIASITNTDLLVAVTEPTLSGESDLLRLVALARRLNVKVAVVLNKADLSERGAERIRARVAAEGLELLGEIPFDPTLASVLQRLATGESAGVLLVEAAPGLTAARGIVAAVADRMT